MQRCRNEEKPVECLCWKTAFTCTYIVRRHYVGDDGRPHAEKCARPFILKLNNFTNIDVPIRGNVFAIMIRGREFSAGSARLVAHSNQMVSSE